MSVGPGRVALVVDDSRLDHLMTRGLLLGSSAGFTRVDWLAEWPGAATALADVRYDLYIVDMQLGSASGLDVVRDLRAAGVLEPIIAMTGQADEAIDRACTDAGASDFLVKGSADRTALERSIRYADRQAAVHRELDRLNDALERRATAEGEQARLMRFAIEQSSDGIFITKVGPSLAEHVVVYVNAALCRIVGRRAGALLGEGVARLFDEDDFVTDPDLVRAIAAHASYARVVELPIGRQTARLTLRASPLRSTGNRVTHYVWTCRDRASAVDASISTLQRERFETIGRITVGVAHDLNERLTALTGNLDLLARRQNDDASSRLVEAASRATEDLVAQASLLVELSNRDDGAADGVVDLAIAMPAMTPLVEQAVGRLVRVRYRPDNAPLWRASIAPGRLELALLTLATGLFRGASGDTRELSITTRNVPAADASRDLDRAFDHVGIALVDDGPPRDEPDTGPEADGALRRVERLVDEAGGALVVERNGRARRMATIFLRRAAD